MHHDRHDEQGEPAGQRDQPEAVRVAGQHGADERQEREGARQADLVDRAVGAPVLRRHQFGGDRERRGDRKAEPDAGQQADDDQLLGGLHERDHQREEGHADDADLDDQLAADVVGDRRGDKAADDDEQRRGDGQPADLVRRDVQRAFGQDEQRAGQRQIIPVDKADEPEHQDHRHVEGAERNAVELAAQDGAGGIGRCGGGRIYGHGVLLTYRFWWATALGRRFFSPRSHSSLLSARVHPNRRPRQSRNAAGIDHLAMLIGRSYLIGSGPPRYQMPAIAPVRPDRRCCRGASPPRPPWRNHPRQSRRGGRRPTGSCRRSPG